MPAAPPPTAPQVHRLPHRDLQEGRDYWLLDDALADPLAVRARQLARTDWTLGAPHRPETWPGMRAQPALRPDELAPIDDWVRAKTGSKRLFQPPVASPGALLNHNCVQLVAARESRARPHTDSKALCRYAGVLYLSPDGPAHAGTSFFRVRLPDGRPGGNTIASRHATLAEALGTALVSPDLFEPELAIDYRFNRLLVYRADLIHSATAYFGGDAIETRRMAAVFFWMAA
jgi:hypothetical protein